MTTQPEQEAYERGRLSVIADLKDGDRVHAVMLRGEIGIPSIRQILHLHGADMLKKWDEMATREHEAMEDGFADAVKQAAEICESVRAHWSAFHSVAPIAAAQCKSRIEALLNGATLPTRTPGR